MQSDMFGVAIEESATREAVPPVLSASGIWLSPELLAFNAALKRGSLKDSLAVLNRLKVGVAAQVLLASGFTVGPSDNKTNLIAFVQMDILAAIRLRMTGAELRASREVAQAVAVEDVAAVEVGSVDRERITSALAANMRAGALVVDSDGRRYHAFSARFSYLEVHPLGADGKPEIFAGNSVFFHLDPATAEAYPGRRHDPVYLAGDLDVAKSQEGAHNEIIHNAEIVAREKEIQHDGRIGEAEDLRSRGGEQDRGDGRDGGVDREPLANGLAGSGEAVVGGGDVLGASGEPSRAGGGGVGERGAASAPGAARGNGAVRNSVGAAVDVKAVSGGVAGRKFTREELSKLYVTDMTDEQLLAAKDIDWGIGRVKAIARQIEKRGIVLPAVEVAAAEEIALPVEQVAASPSREVVPAWYTQIPEAGLPMVASEFGLVGYREVGPRIAKEAVGAITQIQKLGGAELYAYVLLADGDVNGRVRFVPDDQPAPKGWSLLNNAAYRPGMLSDEQMIGRLSQELSNSPVLGVKQEVKVNSPEKTSVDDGVFTPQDGWRDSLLKTRAYAVHLGIDTKEKSARTLLDEIEVKFFNVGAGQLGGQAGSLKVGDQVTFTDHVNNVFHPGDVATVHIAGPGAVQFGLPNGGTAWVQHERLNRDSAWVLSSVAARMLSAQVRDGEGQALGVPGGDVGENGNSPAQSAGFDGLGEAQGKGQGRGDVGGDGLGATPVQSLASGVTRDDIAKRYAQVLAEGREGVSAAPNDFHFKFADGVLAKDAFALKWIVNGLNDKSKRVFTEFTGTKLPKAQGAAWEALKVWAGVTVEQAAEVAAKAEAARVAKQELAQDERAEADAVFQRLREPDGTVVNCKQIVDRQIAEGHTEIRNISTTPIPKYVLVNGTKNQFYPLDKVAKAYAEVALKRLRISGQSLAVDVDSVISVEQAAAEQVEHERELRDAAARGQTMASADDLAHLFGVSREQVVSAVGEDQVLDAVAGVADGAPLQAVPNAVRDRVRWALGQMSDVKSSLDSVERARGNGQILALEWKDQEQKLVGPRKILAEFRKMAPGNGVDADRFLEELGGVPDFGQFESPAAVMSVAEEAPAKVDPVPASATPADIKTYSAKEAQAEWDKSSQGMRRVYLSRLQHKNPALETEGWDTRSWTDLAASERTMLRSALDEDFYAPNWYINTKGQQINKVTMPEAPQKTAAQIDSERGEQQWKALDYEDRVSALLQLGMGIGEQAEQGKFSQWNVLAPDVRVGLLAQFDRNAVPMMGALIDPVQSMTARETGTDYVLTDEDRIGLGGLAEKFQDNLQAIRVLKVLETEKRHAVGDELRELARYVGWGGLKGVFDPDNKQWGKQHVALRSLLSDAEWAAASRSQLNAFYTPPVVAKAMFAGVSRLGFERGRVLEPSVGVGNFFGLMPEAMRQNSALHGVELDVLTSRIVAALYPSAKIAKATGFQSYNVPAGYFDMAVGNPPFGSETVTDDRGSAYSGWSIHNYFFAKSIDMLRPGGIMPMVVSHSFLDKLDPHVRQWIARRAELVSGARLPNTAFKGSANTEVVTDVLIFRRLDNENELGKQELPDWLDTTDVMIENPKTGESEAIAVNNYFINNPQNVLGTNSAASSQFRANEYTVLPSGDLESQLAQWVETLPVGIYVPLERTAVELEVAAVAVPEFVKEGSFFVLEGGKSPARGAGLGGSGEAQGKGAAAVEVWQRLPDQLGERQAVKWEPANQRAFERMVGMIGIREALRGQMRLERSMDAGEAEIEAGRRSLNRVYDGFQSKYGFVNDPINRRLFLDDTESALIQALEFDYEKAVTPMKAEEYGIDPRPARAVKADIFSRRVLFPPVEVEVVQTAKDALLHSLNLKGAVDLDYMQGAYGKDKEAIIAELGDLLFVDPVAGMVTADEYLSGDVKTKMAEAVKAAERDLSLSRNVEALKAVIPADKMPSEIHAAMGASWIPPEMFSAFAKEVSGADATYTYLKGTGQWLSRATSQPDYVKNETEFGTNKMAALEILTQTMNSRGLEVKKPETVNGSVRYVTDEEATEAVRQRSDKMRGHWDSWLWADGGRADKLMSIYNERFNRTVERSYDGSHLTFPGMNPAISLLIHQKNGVWRALQDRGLLLDQVVGAGKTFEIAAMAMEMRRLGISKKPLIGVPNHLTLQWRSEFYRLYPGANVLAATPQDFDKENRERFFSKIVTGNWDAVIVGHSSLKKIAVPMEMEVKIIKEQFDDMAAAIEDMKRDRGDRNIIRDMEKIKSNLEAKMTKLKESGGKKDNVVDFADLGVDAIIVDEMHEFKNLTFTTQMNRVSGLGNPAGSGKAFDLFVKIRWLQETFGDKAPLITATGTPISNSLAEMFTMQRYMQYGKLKENGLNVFDAWAKQYGDVQNVYEVAPSGTGYRLSQRFAKFKNLPSLMGEYRSFADVITLDDLKAQEAAQGKVFPVPKLIGGRPLNVVAERSELQEKFFGIPEIVRNEAGEIQFEVDLKFPVTIDQREDGKFVALQDMGGHVQTSKPYDTKEEAEYMTALGATTPKMTVDPKSIVGQFENLRQLTRETKGKINALSLTGLANKAGLDYRLINPAAVDFPGSKVNIAVRNMLAIGKQWEADKGVQLVFCDQSVPLSAKAKMASKEKRVYVREDDERLTHKKGTLHTVKEYEGLPYFLVAVGKGDGKTFSMYDPVCGRLMKDGFDSKQAAHAFVAAFVAREGGQERWLDQRELSRPIGVDEIDEYKNEHAIDADGDAADLEISMQDIEGVTGVSGFSIYDDMKAKLIAGGVPAHQIEFIHDHDTPQAKDLLFKRVNAGDVRYLFGSTPKMGAGTNVQKRLVGLHHIDAPWRPSDLEQREGRIIRRGNSFYERDPVGFMVAVNRYATAQTYDTRRWQLLEHKAAGLEQLRNYDGANEIDDVANEASNSADMKAAASGNPLILKETQLTNEVKKLRMLERAHRDGEYSIRSRFNQHQQYAGILGPEELTALRGLQAERDGAVVLGELDGKKLLDKEMVVMALGRVATIIEKTEEPKDIVYRGVSFEFKLNGFLNMPISMTTPDGYRYDMDKLSPTGAVTRMDNWCEGIEDKIAGCERKIAGNLQEAGKIAGQLGKPFEQADKLLASIAEHGKVQRALMKSNSMAAVKPEEMAAFQAAVDGQKAMLRSMGLGRGVDEIEREAGEVDAAANGQGEGQGPALSAGFDGLGEARGKGVVVGGGGGAVAAAGVVAVAADGVDLGDMEQFIKVAADSIGELRKVDVFRVLVESNRAVHREAIADYIKGARPDLVGEVDEVMEEARTEFSGVAPLASLANQVAEPATIFGLSGAQIEAMQGGKLRGAEQFPGLAPVALSAEQMASRASALLAVREGERAAVDVAAGQDVRLAVLRDAGIEGAQILQAAKELAEGDDGLIVDLARIAGVSLPAAPLSRQAEVVREGVFSGRITEVADGLVTQKYNREGDIVRHSLGRLSDAVAVGDVVDIKYQGGVGQVSGLAIEAGRGR